MSPGDVLRARVPSGSNAPAKLRPALVIAVLPGAVEESVLVCGISSRVARVLEGWDVVLSASALATSGLKVPSVVRPSWLATFSPQESLRRIGGIDASILARLGGLLASSITVQNS